MRTILLLIAVLLGVQPGCSFAAAPPVTWLHETIDPPGPLGPRYQHPKAFGPITPFPHVEIRGTGPVPVVLLAGLGTDWRIWEPFMERNEDRYTMYAVTLPGFGGDDPPPMPEIAEAYFAQPWAKNAARATVQLILDEHLDRPIIMGHSIGGQVALIVSLIVPEITRGIISVDGEPAFLLGMPDTRLTREQRRDFVRNQIAPGFSRGNNPDAWAKIQEDTVRNYLYNKDREDLLVEMVRSAPMQVMQEYILEFAVSDFSDRLAQLQTPTLFIAPMRTKAGEKEKIDRELRWYDMLDKAAEGTKVVFFYDSSSYVMDDQPTAFDEAVRAFVAGEEVEGVPDPSLEDE